MFSILPFVGTLLHSNAARFVLLDYLIKKRIFVDRVAGNVVL
jgi:hypothetical protein